MKSINMARNLVAALLCAALSASGQSVDLVGSLRNEIGDPLSGKIDIIEEGPRDILRTSGTSRQGRKA